jgi:hypothetical protein
MIDTILVQIWCNKKPCYGRAFCYVGAFIERPRATDGRPYGAGGALVPPVLVYEFFGGSKPPPYGEGGVCEKLRGTIYFLRFL